MSGAALVVLVIVCGSAMALVRFGIAAAFSPVDATSRPARWPWPVFLVNAAGSALAGIAAGAAAVGALPSWVETVALVGVAGGLTTFSTLYVEAVQLWRAGRRRTALASLGASYVVALALSAAGWAVAAAVWG